jgi:hypothetical protein
MSKPVVNFEQGDDLSDLLGRDARPAAPRAEYQNIRETVFTEYCPKCQGRGRFIRGHRDFGPCYACKGAGKQTFKTSPDKRHANRLAANTRREEAKATALEGFAANYPAEHAWMVAQAPTFGFAAAMVEAVKKYGELTEGQLAAVRKCAAARSQRKR